MENLTEGLKQTKDLAIRLGETIKRINRYLEVIQSKKVSSEFKFKDVIKGEVNGIICILTKNTQDNPLETISKKIAQQEKVPTIIFARRSKDERIIRRSIQYIQGLINEQKEIDFIFIITQSRLLPPLEKRPTVVIGRRYIHVMNNELDVILEKLRLIDINVEFDTGEYGGGIITYFLCEKLHSAKTVVMEFTMSESIVKDEKRIHEVFRALYN